MTQWEIDRAVAAATGETVAEVRRQGFSLLESSAMVEESESRHPMTLNWDTGQPMFCPWT
jgi:hypothetical protein